MRPTLPRHLPLAALVWLTPGVALAHPGHLGELASHDHWVAGAAIGLAILTGLWGALKGRKTGDNETDSDTEEAPEEQAA